MIVSGLGWITDKMCGSALRGQLQKFQDPKALYQQLEAEGFFRLPVNKIRWLNTVSQRYCLAAALALRDASVPASEIQSPPHPIGMLSLSRDGALMENQEYFQDYINSGRKLARGNLFVHTLPTSPLAEAAMTFHFKGPVFHLSAANPKMNLLLDRSEALAKRFPDLGLMCCIANERAVLAILLSPEKKQPDDKIISIKEFRAAAGNLWELSKIFKVLKIGQETVRVD